MSDTKISSDEEKDDSYDEFSEIRKRIFNYIMFGFYIALGMGLVGTMAVHMIKLIVHEWKVSW